MSEPHLLRDPFVALVRLRYVLRALSAIHYRPDHVWLKGDACVGQFSEHDGTGDFVSMAWDEAGVVALGFDHEQPETERDVALDERTPERFLSGAPPELGAIVKVVSGIELRLATTGFWATSKRASARFLERPLRAYAIPVAAAVEAWTEQLSIDPAQMALGVALAERSLRDRTTLTAEEEQMACATPAVSQTPCRSDDVRGAAKLLAAVGVDWDPEPFLAKRVPQPRTARENASARLLRAAFDGDLEGVEAALAAGADVDARTTPEQLVATPTGATALVIALRRGHREVAERLLTSGANVELETEPTQGGADYALRVPAGRGDPVMVQRLLERGASVRPHEEYWGVLRHVHEGHRHRQMLGGGTDVEYGQVVRLLVARGAPQPRHPFICDELAMLAAVAAPDAGEPRAERAEAEDW